MEVLASVQDEEKMLPPSPSEKRPKQTIQDAYLKAYFVGYSQNIKMNNTPNVTHNKSLAKEMKDYLKITNTNIEESSSTFSRRKTNRNIREVDPLDVMTVRGYNGQFVTEHRKKKIEVKEGNINTYDDALEEESESQAASFTNDHIYKSAEFSGRKIHSQKYEENSDEDELVPMAFRKKINKK